MEQPARADRRAADCAAVPPKVVCGGHVPASRGGAAQRDPQPRPPPCGAARLRGRWCLPTMSWRCCSAASSRRTGPPTPAYRCLPTILALQIRRGYEGMLIALPAEQWSSYDDADPTAVAAHLTRLARNVVPRQVAASPRGPKRAAKKGYVDAAVARGPCRNRPRPRPSQKTLKGVGFRGRRAGRCASRPRTNIFFSLRKEYLLKRALWLSGVLPG